VSSRFFFVEWEVCTSSGLITVVDFAVVNLDCAIGVVGQLCYAPCMSSI